MSSNRTVREQYIHQVRRARAEIIASPALMVAALIENVAVEAPLSIVCGTALAAVAAGVDSVRRRRQVDEIQGQVLDAPKSKQSEFMALQWDEWQKARALQPPLK